ncbi:hypothetical protein [Sphingopyxis microcysteis]|uniref:hypothetical protein n=1 Tax=Sphingopyxis microcysteis TaxID=2484145 RepID=UPI00144648D5|nr:hypothetical protein [Sphingopyxis microcysteis]
MRQPETADEEWRRLLKGGFAFETAPFAVHPKDSRRAERMFFVAARAGADKSDILCAAADHLRDHGVNENGLTIQLAGVERFLDRYKIIGKARSSWLVFWNGTDCPVADFTNNLVVALDPRTSEQKILDFLELHYRAVEYSSRELLYYSTRKKKSPYRASAVLTSDHRLIAYTCGHNPWLEARFCKNIVVFDVEGEKQKVTWSTDSRSPG